MRRRTTRQVVPRTTTNNDAGTPDEAHLEARSDYDKAVVTLTHQLLQLQFTAWKSLFKFSVTCRTEGVIGYLRKLRPIVGSVGLSSEVADHLPK